MKNNIYQKYKIAIIGLGYVGLPLAIEFSKYFHVNAFDIDKKRINELKKSYDRNSTSVKKLNLNNKNINYTSNIKELRVSNFYIITVPTPIKKNKSVNNFLII